MGVNITTDVNSLRLVRDANSTANSFGALIPTATEPDESADGVIKCAVTDANNEVFVIPFGVGSDTDTFAARVVGWSARSDTGNTVWVPYQLLDVTCALTTAVGIAGTQPADTDKFCDTITSPSGIADHSISSPADNTVAFFTLDVKGSRYIQIQFDLLTGSTEANALYRFI